MSAQEMRCCCRRCILWDLDGTLIDSEPLHAHTLDLCLSAFNVRVPERLSQSFVGLSEGQIHDRLTREFGLRCSFDSWRERRADEYITRVDCLKPRTGALELVLEAHEAGVQQAIVSNSHRRVVDASLCRLRLPCAIPSVSRDDVRTGKPSPEPYLLAAALLRRSADQSTVVEDSTNGARAGVAAGMRTLFWPQTGLSAPVGSVRVRDAEELRRLLTETV